MSCVQLSLGVRWARMRLTLSCCRIQGTGIAWRLETTTNSTFARDVHTSDVYAGRLWVFGGNKRGTRWETSAAQW